MSLDLFSLNPAQRNAVTAPNGPTLIVAGPGTGKTHTLAYRIAYQRQRSHPPGMLAVTFTQKAAQEMAERVTRLNGGVGTSENLWIGTFHRLGLNLLRRDGHRVGIKPDAHILSEAEQASLLKTVLKEVLPGESRHQVRRWIRRLSACKQGGAVAEEADAPLRNVVKVYEERLSAFNALDYDDLIIKTFLLFQEAPSVLREVRNRFRSVLIDEYQDINDGQYQLVKELCGENADLWVIGDADQAIYAFRGAQVEHFLRFKEDFPETLTITLDMNYRSTPTIIQCAQAVIAHNVHRMPGSLVPTCHAGNTVQVLRSSDDRAEARFVVNKIKRLVGGISMETTKEADAAYGFSDIAILYRLHALSRTLVKALGQAGIPCQVVGGTDFPENSAIDTLLSFLKGVANPHDNNAITALLPKIDRRFDFASVATLAREAKVSGQPLYSYLFAVDATPACDTACLIKAQTMLLTMRRYCDESSMISLGDLLKAVCKDLFEESELDDGAFVELGVLAKPLGCGAASEQIGPFLESVALWKEGESYNPNVEAVTLMSTHAAKGLEFPVVFVVGLEEGVFPSNAFGEEPSDREEERRLFYVAMTRAKRRLYLSSAKERWLFGEKRKNGPSLFLEEIPEELVTHVREKRNERASQKVRVKQKSLF